MMKLGIGAVAKNEGPYLLEWLAWYLIAGFDKIVVAERGSTDATRTILEKLSQHVPQIEVRDQVFTEAGAHPSQKDTYRDMLKADFGGFDWVAFFDLDEFLLCPRLDVKGYLDELPEDAGAVLTFWNWFGSNGETTYRPRPVIERFDKRAGRGFCRTAVGKCIVKPAGLRKMHLHTADTRNGFFMYDGSLEKIESETYQVEDLKAWAKKFRPAEEAYCRGFLSLNHYALKSAEEFAWKKDRGYIYNPGHDEANPAISDSYFKHGDKNVVTDERAKKFLPAVRDTIIELHRLLNL